MAPEPSVVSAMIGRNPAMIVSYAGGMRRVLGNPRAYTILAPVLTVLGAATTIIVPEFPWPRTIHRILISDGGVSICL